MSGLLRRGVTLIIVGCVIAPVLAGQVITWVPPYSIPQCKTMLQRDFGGVGMKDGLTHLALQFWVPDGGTCRKVRSYSTISDADIIWFRDWGRQHAIKVLLCIYNAESGWDWTAAVNSFVNNQDAFVQSTIAEMDRLQLDGVEIDLEGPNQDNTHKNSFVSYARKLADNLHPRGKHVTVATFAYTYHAPNCTWWPDLMTFIDGITSMGYEEIGVNGSGWASYAGQKGLATVPEKLFLGMPGGRGSWLNNSVTEHLAWVVNDGQCGVGIWDCALGNSAWQTAQVWQQLAAIVEKGATKGPYALTVRSENGTVTRSPARDLYEAGTSVTLTATANDGYLFAGWSGDAAGTENPLTITMNAPAEVVANFVSGGELIRNGDFSQGTQFWTLNQTSAQATGSVVDGVYTLTTQQSGTEEWHIQLLQEPFGMLTRQSYVLQFTAWADAPRQIAVTVNMAATPWTRYIDNQDYVASLSSEPEHFMIEFTMTQPTDLASRIEFNAGTTGGTIFLDNVSLRSGSIATRTCEKPIGGFTPALSVRPVVNGITLSVPVAQYLTAHLLDSRGRIVGELASGHYPAGSHTLQLSALKLSAGSYLLRVRTAEGDIVTMCPVLR